MNDLSPASVATREQTRQADGFPRLAIARESDSMISATLSWPGDDQPLLADIIAMLECLRLRVAAHHQPDPAPGPGTVHHFVFEQVDIPDAILPRLAEAFDAAARGEWRIDRYGRLIAAAGIRWREALLLRAACRFLRQTPLGFSEEYLLSALESDPMFVRALLTLFHARLDPDPGTDSASADTAMVELVEAATTLDDDRIRRALHAFVRAVVRTNWFQVGSDGRPKPYVSFKIDSAQLAHQTPVVPYREIFVHSDEVEGVHVRTGAVARGGLRWSDRTEDFRTEALGLMKTQAVKNAPIVPMGAKGAFVLRSPNASPRRGYETFVRGMLDITDNVVDGAIVHPPRTRCLDGQDAYLVVAADKGTAHFSDLANAIAAEYQFWLADAFASGGSTGYDHKALGITARGAWLSVEQHLAELGHDLDTMEFTVAGIGDMSGDVFGNGMLLSRRIKLVAAFDHRHVFLDPDPDPETSFRERARLFQLPLSNWSDYDRSRISSGGGVWSRSAKSIPLSVQVRKRLGIAATHLGADELVSAILRAPVVLLWNGGIGTYVKASTESHADAQDPVNDRVRIDAGDLRCSIVGEGGNLGLTQLGRIEYAHRGGRVNADFIDNAAGVATSDYEVNIKIALDLAQRQGVIGRSERNALLHRIEHEVAARVLSGCRRQVAAISVAEARARQLFGRHVRLIGNLQSAGGIEPRVEGLPSPDELTDRALHGGSLTRPEIAVLLAQSKNLVAKELLASTVPDEALFAERLPAYFPTAISMSVGKYLYDHPLRDEIIATSLADELVNNIGPGAVYWLQERFGVSTRQVALSYVAVAAIYGIEPATAGSSGSAPDNFAVVTLTEQAMSWLLRCRSGDIRPQYEIDRLTSGVRCTIAAAEAGDLPYRVLPHAMAFAEVAAQVPQPVEKIAATFRELAARLGTEDLIAALSRPGSAAHWDALAAANLYDELVDLHMTLTTEILGGTSGTEPKDAVGIWLMQHSEKLGRLRALLSEARKDHATDVAKAYTIIAVARTLLD